MTATKELKEILTKENPGIKFSVRKTRNNGWVGQVIEVNWDGVIDSSVYWTVRLFESMNSGYQVECVGRVVVNYGNVKTVTK